VSKLFAYLYVAFTALLTAKKKEPEAGGVEITPSVVGVAIVPGVMSTLFDLLTLYTEMKSFAA
jgi:hypothetical protein